MVTRRTQNGGRWQLEGFRVKVGSKFGQNNAKLQSNMIKVSGVVLYLGHVIQIV